MIFKFKSVENGFLLTVIKPTNERGKPFPEEQYVFKGLDEMFEFIRKIFFNGVA